MKKIIKKLILFASVMCLIQTVNAQNPPERRRPKQTPEQRVEHMLIDMKANLTLTDDQVQQIKPILLERENNRDQDMEHRKGDRKKMDDSLNKILTPDQMAAFRKLEDERKARFMENREHPHQE